MADINQLQVRYANLIDLRLRAGLVTLDTGSVAVFNTRYEGSPKAGAVKIPVRDAEVAVNEYDRVNGATLTTSTTSYITVTDFHDVVVNELIDGFEAQAVPDNIVADRLDSAGYSGQRTLDADALGTLASQGTVGLDNTATSATNVYGRLVDARTLLSNNNVPATGRWAIVTPAVYSALLKDTTNFIRQGDMSQTLVEQGFTGMCAGFAIKESNQLPAGVEYICGHADWCHRVREWIVLPHVQDLNGDGKHIGASAVQGRWVYKHKVSKAAAVYVKTINVLTVTSVAGTNSGATKISVAPALVQGDSYVYTVADAGTIGVPAPGTDLSSWTAWDGAADIVAATGKDIVIAEVSSATVNGATVKTCVKAGKASVTAKA